MDQLTAEDPRHIGPYRLIARLGAGGMGLVYLGRSEGGRTVAVKVVQAEYAGNAEFRRRFAREVAAARRVGGNWTAAVLDADHEAAVPWVATQYIPGPDLHSVVAEDFGPLPEHSVRALANRLALALGAVHQAGLIHRDLKPSNVLVTVDGPRVIDFGIARAMDSLAGDSLHTRTGMLIGSPGFMSPEQVRGLELTPASDVFCLGAVLVYAATGRMLFGATDTGLNAHLFRIAEEEADLTGVPDSLVDLVRACLEKDPARRPTPREIAERTATDDTEEWLPGSVLAQLGRHAAQLLDFAPPTPVVPAQPDPRVALAHQAAAPGAYTPTTPAHAAPYVYGGAGAVPMGVGPTAPRDATPGGGRHRWVLALAALLQLLVVIDATVSALSAWIFQRDLGLPHSLMGGLPMAYAAGLGAVLPLGGHLADRAGRKAVVVGGLVAFVVAALLEGLAPGAPMLLAARALHGIAAALLMPAALSMVARSRTEPSERRAAFAVYAVVAVGGGAVGAGVAGAFTEFLSWRLVGYVGILLAVLAVIGAARMPDGPTAEPRGPFDLPGVLLGGLALGALGYGLAGVRGLYDGEANPTAGAVGLAGLVLLAVFLAQQRSAPAALLGPDALKDRARVGAYGGLALLGVALFGLYDGASMRLVHVLGLGPFLGGLMLLPALLAALLGVRLASARLARDGRARSSIVLGTLLTAAGLGLLGGLPVSATYLAAGLPALLLAGFGAGLAALPLYSLATPDEPGVRTGGAASLATYGAPLGTLLGTLAAGGSLLFGALVGAVAALLAALVGGLTAGRTGGTPAQR
ncbi:MFS transporter [Streptomyces sp. SKN60]|uniref:MFS transporter n=1 Tax=Streptomyces sp. SKN60 TaxID=2855506 RepID=UPI0022476181|nr:MFS transporter [Streptomyces sp. SKN60]MCX2185505.1 MFS transporter [Streptomyces sp. SKN60]